MRFQFQFPEISSHEITAFSRISGKEENLPRYTKIFGNYLPRITVPFDFLPGIFGLCGSLFENSTISEFSGDLLTIRPVTRKGYGSIAHEAKPNGLLTRGP